MKIAEKVLITGALLVLVVFVIAFAGRETIHSSAVYELAMAELQKKYAIDPSMTSIPFLKPFRFSEGDVEGAASFVVCDRSTCFDVDAHKIRGKWTVATSQRP